MPVTVARLTLTPVKGTRLREVERLRLDQSGVRENRRFFLIDDRDRMVNAKNLGVLQSIVSHYSDPDRRLRLEFPDGQVLQDTVELGEEVTTRFYSRPLRARLVTGEWSEAFSRHCQRPVRLVEGQAAGAVDRGAQGAVSLISQASLLRLAEEAGSTSIDPRRFRMLVEVDGVEANAEDGWIGHEASIGEARVRFGGHVGRCLITGRDPDSGHVDLPTLDILAAYRGNSDTTEPLALGIYGRVVQPGEVRVGDPVVVDRTA